MSRTRAAVARGVVAVLSAIVVVGLLASGSGAATDVTPGVFNEVSTGVALITTFGCGGRPIASGSGFLVGDSVVMTARHVLLGACKARVHVNGENFPVTKWSYWHGNGASASAADVATIKLERSADDGHVFRVRTTLQPVGSNVGMVGYPLGNRLSLNQGKLIARGKRNGAPLLAVRMLGAEGASGAPFIDDAGRVVGILQIGLGSKDVLGQRTSGVLVGLDLVRWWGPRARLDLCRAYPNGGIAGCPTPKPPPPPQPAEPPPPPPPPPAPPTLTFNDSTNEDANAPDITSVVVSATSARLVTFQVRIPNRPTLTQDMFVLIFVDTDRNPSTGDVSSVGADYVIQLVPGAVDLFRWNGVDFVAAGAQSSLTYGYASGATIHVSTSDLGNTTGFNFGVIAVSGVTFDASGKPNFDNIHRDLAPDQGHGYWNYAFP